VRRLPYDLVLTVITDEALQRENLQVCAQFVGIMHDIHVDCEPHEEITRLRTIRLWDNVETAASQRALSSRLTTCAHIDWHKFDGLKTFVLEYLTKSTGAQTATHTSENAMILSLLKLLYQLVRGGFFVASEMNDLRSTLLHILDGRSDTVCRAQANIHPLHLRSQNM
jgi:hypothetical protein